MAVQALLSAGARIVVRELRKTETTDVIMVYSGTMHCFWATVACLAMPGSLKILQHSWQVAMLLGTGTFSISVYNVTIHLICATMACLAMLIILKILQHSWQAAMLLDTGSSLH